MPPSNLTYAEKPTVLVVDDHPTQRQMLAGMLLPALSKALIRTP